MSYVPYQDVYSAYLPHALDHPADPQVWERLSKIAPTLSSKVTFEKYAKYLKTRVPQRIYRKQSAASQQVTSVTFVVLNHYIITRVDKIAHTARAAGLKVQLVLCFQPPENFAIDHTLYSDVCLVSDMFLHLTDALKQIRKFGSSLIHLFVGGVTNLKAAFWGIRSPLPIVGDPYDLCCTQYTHWPHDEQSLKNNVFCEHVWLQHVDGICIRNHYLKTKKMQAAYRPGVPVFYLPEPVRTAHSVCKKRPVDIKNINLIMDGAPVDNIHYKDAYTELFNKVKQAGNIHIHLYRCSAQLPEEFSDIIRIYPHLPEKVFAVLMKNCDAFIIPWSMHFMDEAGYTRDMCKYCTRSTASDIMEKDIINIVPDYHELIAQNAIRCNRGIPFSLEDQRSVDFWKDLPNKIAKLYNEKSVKDRFLDTNAAPHLVSFYRRTFKKTFESKN